MTRKIFNIPGAIDDATPMIESPFYDWLMKPVERQNTFTTAIREYLVTVGFNLETDKLIPGQYDSLKSIFDHYSTMYTPIKNPCRLNALLKPTNGPKQAFYVQGLPSDRRYKPTAILNKVIHDLGLVYDANPENIYFKIVNNYLFVCYQQILGSRRLAKICSDSEAFNQSNEV